MKTSSPVLFFRKIQRSSSLFYNTIHSLVTAVLSVLLSLATSVLVARGLGPAAKGGVDIIFATTNLLVMIFGFSLTSGIVYVIAQGRSAVRKLIVQLIILSFVQSLLSGVFLILVLQSDVSSEIFPKDIQEWSVFAVILLVFLNLVNNYYYSIFVGFQDFPKVNRCGILVKIASFLIMFSFFVLSGLGVWEFNEIVVIWVSVISSVFSIFLLRYFVVPLLNHGIESKGSGIREILFYSIPAYMANVVQYLSYRLDIFIVGFFMDLRGVGLYALSVNISQSIWLFSGTISNVFYPNVASTTDKNLINHRTARVARLTLFLNVILCFILAFVGANFLPFIFGEDFRESILPLLWLLPGVAIFGVTNVISSYVVGMGKPGLTFWFAIVCLVVTVFLDISLIPLWGIEGAAIASSTAYIAASLFSILVFVQETGINPLRLVLPEKDDFAVVVRFFYGRNFTRPHQDLF
jgi:O-antigen/teichoic acid export membrane protein